MGRSLARGWATVQRRRRTWQLRQSALAAALDQETGAGKAKECLADGVPAETLAHARRAGQATAPAADEVEEQEDR